jgi:hypothetical protein
MGSKISEYIPVFQSWGDKHHPTGYGKKFWTSEHIRTNVCFEREF